MISNSISQGRSETTYEKVIRLFGKDYGKEEFNDLTVIMNLLASFTIKGWEFNITCISKTITFKTTLYEFKFMKGTYDDTLANKYISTEINTNFWWHVLCKMQEEELRIREEMEGENEEPSNILDLLEQDPSYEFKLTNND